MKSTLSKFANVLVVLVLLQAAVFSAAAQPPSPLKPAGPAPSPDTPSAQAPQRGLSQAQVQKTIQQKLSGFSISPLDATLLTVEVRGTMPSLSEKAKSLDAAGRLAYAAQVKAFQDGLEKGIVASGGKVIYRFHTLTTGVIAQVPGNQIVQVAAMPTVQHVARIFDYQEDLSETVPFIGATALKQMGVTGKGVKVAVLDSGIDYTHLAFGGSANPALWKEAYFGSDPGCVHGTEAVCANRNAVSPALSDVFGPNAPKVKGGYDFVGPVWDGVSSAPLEPDPNPIALVSTGAHGTHVADIIAGFGYPAGSYTGTSGTVNYPALGEGVAPGADIYAFQVCSATGSACSGVALLQAIDAAADLDGNPATIDPADVLNMSLGQFYGLPEDNLTYLTDQIVAYGTSVVAAAGNDGDRPFVVSTPSTASGAISVAQTNVPSAKQYVVTIDSPAGIAGPFNAPSIQEWSAAFYTAKITGPVFYDATNANTKRGCLADGVTSPWAAGALTGKIVLIDRGVCAGSVKVSNAEAAGAIFVLIADNRAEATFSFAFGGGTIGIPSFMITQADGNKIKANIAAPVNVTADPANFISLVNSIVQTSARGPRNYDNKLKPDIGAPGASVSAEAGTGSQSTAFGGTSGATPMIAGSVALLKSLFGDQQNFTDPVLSPEEYKSLLMNTANNKIYENQTPADTTGTLLPISRIGAGQVDLHNIANEKLIAMDVTDSSSLEHTGSLSFQYVPASVVTTLTRKIHLRNLSGFDKFVKFSSEFRYASDNNGAVKISPSVSGGTVPANGTFDFTVTLTVDPSKLAPWFDPATGYSIDRGGNGTNGVAFKDAEYDGYFYISEFVGTNVTNVIGMPWQVLPKPVADVTTTNPAGTSNLLIDNVSPSTTSNSELFMLVDSRKTSKYNFTVGDCASGGLLPGCNQTIIEMKEVGVRASRNSNGSVASLDFGITLFDKPFRTSEFPVEFLILVDSNNDGVPDYEITNYDFGYFTAGTLSGQNATFVIKLSNQSIVAAYLVDSTFDSNNYILSLLPSDIGLTDSNLKFQFFVEAADGFFDGTVWDVSPKNWDYHVVDLNHPRMALQPLTPASTTVSPPDLSGLSVAVDPSDSMTVPFTTSPSRALLGSGSQIGFLAMYREAPVQKESSSVVLATPALHFNFVPVIKSNP